MIVERNTDTTAAVEKNSENILTRNVGFAIIKVFHQRVLYKCVLRKFCMDPGLGRRQLI